MASNGNCGFCVPYTVRDTPGRGRGVFADAPIRKGTIIWRHVRGQYAVYDERSLKELLAKMSHSEVVYELEHLFGLTEFSGYVIRVLDDGALINHSRQANLALNIGGDDNEIPNNVSPQEEQDAEEALLSNRFSLIATRDLTAGEELTLDYDIGTEDPSFYDELCEQYDVTWPWL